MPVRAIHASTLLGESSAFRVSVPVPPRIRGHIKQATKIGRKTNMRHGRTLVQETLSAGSFSVPSVHLSGSIEVEWSITPPSIPRLRPSTFSAKNGAGTSSPPSVTGYEWFLFVFYHQEATKRKRTTQTTVGIDSEVLAVCSPRGSHAPGHSAMHKDSRSIHCRNTSQGRFSATFFPQNRGL